MSEHKNGKDSFHPTERFTTKVRDYSLYRPRYPRGLVELLKERAGLGPGMVVADIGSGTGILTEQLLNEGCVVHAVEPNRAMRTKAEGLLGGRIGFISVAGRAEETTLADGSVELITIGQAFHWFELAPTRSEFLRILRPGGQLCLAWNKRDPEGGEFEEGYKRLVELCCPQASKVKALGPGDDEIAAFYGGPHSHFFLPNHQDLDYEGLKGRFLSASYAPGPKESGFEEAVEGLGRLFDVHSRSGIVRFHYQTEVYLGKMVT